MIVERYHTVVPDEPVVELRDVSRRFVKKMEHHRSLQDLFVHFFQRTSPQIDEFWPLRNVSLTINAGDSVGVIGPNGTGKSTLLKLITGILEPTSGELFVRGRISSLLELGAGFHPDLTGRENIFLNGSIYGLSRTEMNQRLDQIIEYAELGDFIDTPVKHYSSGMHLRLGFAVAIFTKPELLLVDEVLAVGDATFQRKCLRSIQEFRDQGGTLLLVSHDSEAIQRICRQVIWIGNGEIKAQGLPTDVVMEYLNDVAQREESKTSTKHEVHTAQQRRRWGTGELRITNVELLDEQGQVCSVFHSGMPLCICLHYEAEQPVDNPIFGLAIYDQNGIHLTGPNTRFGRLPIPRIDGCGTVRYNVPALTLLQGSYSLSVAVVNTTDTETYDYHDRLYTFSVYPRTSTERYGIVTLGGEWQLDTSSHLSEQHERGLLWEELVS